MANTIYEDDRVIVCRNPTNQSRVTIADRFQSGGMSMNLEAFEKMCVAVAGKVAEREAKEAESNRQAGL